MAVLAGSGIELGHKGFGLAQDQFETHLLRRCRRLKARLSPSPRAVLTGLSFATGIGAGSYHTVALKSDRTVWTWGQKTYGQLGDGTTKTQLSPVMVPGLSRFAITSLEMMAGPQAVVEFLSTDGAVHYMQQRTNAASGTWTTVQTNIAGTGGILRVTNAVPAGAPSQVYRVGAAGR